MNFCELTLKYLLSTNITGLKKLTIIIPEDYSTNICHLCSNLIQKLTTQRFHQIQSFKISFPAYKVTGPLVSHLSLNNYSGSLSEIYGLESFDYLFHGLCHHSAEGNFLDLECWPSLKILHLGNLISRFFSILEDTSEDFSSWINGFLSKFTIIRFPAVTTLEFDSVDDQQFLSFIRSLAEFLLPLSQEELDTYLWSSISNLIIDSLPDLSANRFALEEEWMSTVRALRSLSSDSSVNGTLPSQRVLSLFPNASSIHLFSPLPSPHFLSMSSSACLTQSGFWLHGFHDDPILNQYLVTPSLHPLPVGITHLSIFERFCDHQFLQKTVPSFDKRRLLDDLSERNSTPNHSLIDSFLEIFPKSRLLTDLTPLCSRRLSSRDSQLNQFLEYNSASLSYLHINESHLRSILLSDETQGRANLFGNCHQLEALVIELDLLGRGGEETFGYLSKLIQCLGLEDLQKCYSQLRRVQLNVWTDDSEMTLHSFLLSQLTLPSPLHTKVISILIHNRSGNKNSRKIGIISCLPERSHNF